MEYRWIGNKPFRRGRTVSGLTDTGKHRLVWLREVRPGETFVPSRQERVAFADMLEKVPEQR